MTKKVVSIGEWAVEPLTYYEINELVALVRKAKNNNLDDDYVYDYYNSLENKISRIGIALNSLGTLEKPAQTPSTGAPDAL
jgi:hypothetical protein